MPTLTFTSGNDGYVVRDPDIFTLSFLAGDDTLTTINAGATTDATMGDGADVVSHRGGTADVEGDAGADRFEVFASGLTANGGADADLFNIRGGTGLILNGDLGNDRFNFYSSSVNVTLRGGDGDDDFFGYGNSISGSDPTGIYGDAGADYFVGFIGGIVLYGGTGNDIYRADAAMPANFVEAFGQGTDSVQVARGDTYTLPANIENISVSGFSGSTTSFATLTGNSLANTINGHLNDEEFWGMAGSDRIAGKSGVDAAYGGDGNDYLDGGEGNDWLYGESGNDTLQGRNGNDYMAGGLGNDSYYVGGGTDTVVENLDEGIDLVRVTVSFTLPANVENGTISGAIPHVLNGNDLDNVLLGGSGGDQMDAYAGVDTLNGGAGDDSLGGGIDNDTLFGGAGNDFLRGHSEDDILIGGDGNDTLGGFIAGTFEFGNDILQGGNGDDVLYGYAGIDALTGGPGADGLSGGTEADAFIYLAVSDSLPAARDVINDFQTAAGGGADKLDLSAIDANVNVTGDQAFVWTTVPSAAGHLWFTTDGTHIFVNGDTDGDQIADFQVQVSNTAGSFGTADIVF